VPSGKEWSWRKPADVPTARQLSLEEADQSQANEVIDSGAWVGVIKCGGSAEVVDVGVARKRTRRWPRATAMSDLKDY
jgi:hypothetical protein